MSLNISFKSLYSQNYGNNACSFTGNKSNSVTLPTKKIPMRDITDIERYFNTLVEYVNKSGYKPTDKPQKIYDIGCGPAFIHPMVYAFFNGGDSLNKVKNYSSNGNLESDLEIKGVDIDRKKRELAIARARNKHIQGIEYIPKDAIEVLEKEQKQIDVAILRHPSTDGLPHVWRKILIKSHEKLRKGGIIIITTFAIHEKDFIKEIAKNNKMNVVIDEPNKESGIISDKYIMVIKK